MSDDLVARLRQQALDNVPDCGYVAHMLETKAADEIERQQARIAEQDLKIRDLRYISNVNGDWSMKFSKMQDRAEAAERDAALLRKTLQRLSVCTVNKCESCKAIIDAAMKDKP